MLERVRLFAPLVLWVIVGSLAYEAGRRAVKKKERGLAAFQVSILPEDHPRDPTQSPIT